jgi:hypothetical protein
VSIPAIDATTVDIAERALRTYGDLTREQAAKILPLWRYYRDLTPGERGEVLNRFGPAPIQFEGSAGPGW